MGMGVMAIIVPVAMFMAKRGMGMDVLMTFPEEQNE
jgi:hypothetical protein